MRQMCDEEQHPTAESSLYKYDTLTSCLAISPTLHSKEYSHTSLNPPPRSAVTTVRAASAAYITRIMDHVSHPGKNEGNAA